MLNVGWGIRNAGVMRYQYPMSQIEIGEKQRWKKNERASHKNST